MGVAKTVGTMPNKRFSLPGRPSTWFAATVQPPPVRFCTTIGCGTRPSSFRIFATRPHDDVGRGAGAGPDRDLDVALRRAHVLRRRGRPPEAGGCECRGHRHRP